MVNVNMKNGTLKMVFLAIFHLFFFSIHSLLYRILFLNKILKDQFRMHFNRNLIAKKKKNSYTRSIR